ncbi:P1 [Mallotus japonicus virus A]|uniref:P1 n=1 Tax=Mallotus japonicus virus A TaxID=2977935 RepID=A0AAE9NV98_9VIRU|nr:P1 [Mallotus japonicus virus A]
MKMSFVALFFIFFLSCSATELNVPEMALFHSLGNGSDGWLDGALLWGTPLSLCLTQPAQPECTLLCNQTAILMNSTSGQLASILWLRGLEQIKNGYHKVLGFLIESWVQNLCALNEKFERFAFQIGKSAIYFWTWSVTMTVYVLYRLLTVSYLLSFVIVSQVVFAYYAQAWISSRFSPFLRVYIYPVWWITKICFKIQLFLIRFLVRAIRNLQKVKEKGQECMVKGFKSIKFNQTPPKNAVVEVLHEDDTHAGFATCIRLYNGECGLVTALHCFKTGKKIRSLKTGNKIATSQFLPHFQDEENDICLLRGPFNFESVLGLKGAHFTTADKLAKSNCMFFNLDAYGSWQANSAELVGTHKLVVKVLSNTTAGDSGTAYWSGKTVLGVHLGFDPEKENEFNLMAPIPSIAGITAPLLVYETTAPQGRLYSELVLDKYEQMKEAMLSKLRDPNSWANRDDEMDYSVKPVFNFENGFPSAPSPPPTPPARFFSGHLKNSITIPKVEETPLVVAPEVKPVRKIHKVVRQRGSAFTGTVGGHKIFPVVPTTCATNFPTFTFGTTGNGIGRAGGPNNTSQEPKQEEKPLPTPEKESVSTIDTLMNKMVGRISEQRLEEIVKEAVKSKLDQINFPIIEKVERNQSQLPNKPKTKRGKRGGKKMQAGTESTPAPSTNGKYIPPQKRLVKKSQGLNDAGLPNCPTIVGNSQKADGASSSSKPTPSWRRKSGGSAGPSKGPMLN